MPRTIRARDAFNPDTGGGATATAKSVLTCRRAPTTISAHAEDAELLGAGVTRIFVRSYDTTGVAPRMAAAPSVQASVNLASAMRQTLLRRSTRVRHPVTWYDAAESGASLLASFHAGPGQWLRLRDGHHAREAGRRKAAVEHAGLLLTTALAQLHYDWDTHHAPVWVDDEFNDAGHRPDLLFRLGTGQDLAGEARGRTVEAPQRIWEAQTDRLDELHQWAAGPRGTQWFMSWAWLGVERTSVDLFDPGQPRAVVDLAVPEERHAEVLSAWRESAPILDVEVGSRAVRGGWARVEAPNDGGPHWLLLLNADTSQTPWPVIEGDAELSDTWEVSVGPHTIVAFSNEISQPDLADLQRYIDPKPS